MPRGQGRVPQIDQYGRAAAAYALHLAALERIHMKTIRDRGERYTSKWVRQRIAQAREASKSISRIHWAPNTWWSRLPA